MTADLVVRPVKYPPKDPPGPFRPGFSRPATIPGCLSPPPGKLTGQVEVPLPKLLETIRSSEVAPSGNPSIPSGQVRSPLLEPDFTVQSSEVGLSGVGVYRSVK